MDKTEKAKAILSRQVALEAIRANYEPLWKDVINLVVPYRYNLDGTRQKGQKYGSNIYDGSPMTALNLFADGLFGYLVNPAMQWFRLRLHIGKPAEARDVKLWLEDTEWTLSQAFSRSNFYEEMPEYFRDGGAIGTATLYSEEDVGASRIMFRCCHPGQIWVAEDKYGVVDTVHRKFTMTLRQLIQRFGSDNLPPECLNGPDPDEEWQVLHAVYPRGDIEMYFDESGEFVPKKSSRFMPFESVYILMDKSHILSTGGYRLNPYAVWRYRKNSDGGPYGESPAQDAIIDILGLNQIGRSNLLAAQRAVEPPLMVPDELRGKVRINPAGINYYQDHQRMIVPIDMVKSLPAGIDREERKRAIIEDHFKVKFFTMLYQAAMEGRRLSIPQVLEMQGEKATQMGTLVGRLISESFDPIIDRVFQIEWDAGRIPPPPPALRGHRIEIDYMGPLAQAQKKMFMIQGIMQGLDALAPVAQIFPEVRDRVDPDEIAKVILEASGMPVKAIRPDDKVKYIRDQRAKMQDAAMQADMISKMSNVIPVASKAPEKGSLMGTLTGEGGGG